MTVEVTIEKPDKLQYAPRVWADIVSRYPITAIIYAIYPYQNHGTSDRFFTETEFTIRSDFSEGNWPTLGVNGGLCAISSLVGTELEEGEWRPVSLFNPHCHPYGMDYDILQLNHRTFVFLDFEWPNTALTERRIFESLQELTDPWFLFNSGGSYHLIVDRLLVPSDLPKYWGYLINTFSLHPSVRNKEQMISIGNFLCGEWNKPSDLKKLGEEILSNFGHINDKDFSKSVFVIDMRHLAHSLTELAEWLEGKDEAFCFLRISNSPKYPFPPVLAAKGDGEKITIYNYPNRQKSSKQSTLKI